MVSEIQRVSVFGHCPYSVTFPYANSSLSIIEKINRRTIAATFAVNPITTVISCYSPTNVSEEDDVSNFYRELSIYIRSLPKYNIVITTGDFNAHIGHKITDSLYNDKYKMDQLCT